MSKDEHDQEEGGRVDDPEARHGVPPAEPVHRKPGTRRDQVLLPAALARPQARHHQSDEPHEEEVSAMSTEQHSRSRVYSGSARSSSSSVIVTSTDIQDLLYKPVDPNMKRLPVDQNRPNYKKSELPRDTLKRDPPEGVNPVNFEQFPKASPLNFDQPAPPLVVDDLEARRIRTQNMFKRKEAAAAAKAGGASTSSGFSSGASASQSYSEAPAKRFAYGTGQVPVPARGGAGPSSSNTQGPSRTSNTIHTSRKTSISSSIPSTSSAGASSSSVVPSASGGASNAPSASKPSPKSPEVSPPRQYQYEELDLIGNGECFIFA